MALDRKEFLRLGCCAVAMLGAHATAADAPAPAPPAHRCDDGELRFLQGWVTDLMDTVAAELPAEARIRLMAGCGRGCYRRFAWKQELAARGKGDVDKLIEALRQNFEAWREGEALVHVRYGAVNKHGCYCPAARFRPGGPDDLQCHCTQAMHQSIWEAALGRSVKVDIVQSVRRGDPTCHFVVHVG